MNNEYDVIIMGGGPAGSTLGAILARRTTLKVGLFEKEFFPREHIGESLASTVIPTVACCPSYSNVTSIQDPSQVVIMRGIRVTKIHGLSFLIKPCMTN